MAYRDDREALEGHQAELEAKLHELRAKLAESKSVEASMLATVRELEETYAKLNAMKARTTTGSPRRELPLLDRVYIASPCAVPWESMTGDERQRLCASCDKTVYDVSAMTRDEAESLLRAKSTDACLRIFRRFDGTVLTADCPVGVVKKQRARRRGAIAGVLAATAAAATGYAFASRSREQRCDGTRAHSTQTEPTHTSTSGPQDGVQLPPGAMMIAPQEQEPTAVTGGPSSVVEPVLPTTTTRRPHTRSRRAR
jgi:hypothetical protein